LINPAPFLEIKREHKEQTAEVKFMTCSDLISRKGIDLLISAFVRAADSNPHISLTIVGDGPEREDLIALVPKEVRDRITFAGSVPFAERIVFFAQADIFVHPSRHDGWGVVIQEALCAGLPVIATKQTGAAYELVEEGKNGFLVEADDEAALTARLLWFAAHPEQIPSLSRHARIAASWLTPDWGATELLKITAGILQKRWQKRA
jgi:glycosyltransferase involved in cell wall biosynthesis